MQDDQFKLISDGLHFSLLSLLETKKCRSDVAWLSHRLNATQKQVERCLSRLHRLNLIKSKDGKKWQVTGAEVKTTDHVASLAIRRYHEDRFEEAKEKINKVPLELRDFNSVTIAVNAAKLREAKLLIREFKERIKELLSKGEKDEVYRFNIQLYPVTEINQFEEKK